MLLVSFEIGREASIFTSLYVSVEVNIENRFNLVNANTYLQEYSLVLFKITPIPVAASLQPSTYMGTLNRSSSENILKVIFNSSLIELKLAR